jgi:acyl-CoA synthetase (AMP-forming)/AMP-acid ligase II
MRRYRRLVLIDRLIPFLAAIVGLVALAGAVAVQLNTDAKTKAVTEAVVALRASVDQLGKRAETAAAPVDDGTAAGLLALQDRMVKLEGEWTAQKTAAAATPAAVPGAAEAGSETAEIDPNLPTTDCIPLGTRFMVTPGESYPLCQSKAVVKTGLITADTVDIDGVGQVVETGFGTIAGTTCTVMVFSADEAGFAEVRVTCT